MDLDNVILRNLRDVYVLIHGMTTSSATFLPLL